MTRCCAHAGLTTRIELFTSAQAACLPAHLARRRRAVARQAHLLPRPRRPCMGCARSTAHARCEWQLLHAKCGQTVFNWRNRSVLCCEAHGGRFKGGTSSAAPLPAAQMYGTERHDSQHASLHRAARLRGRARTKVLLLRQWSALAADAFAKPEPSPQRPQAVWQPTSAGFSAEWYVSEVGQRAASAWGTRTALRHVTVHERGLGTNAAALAHAGLRLFRHLTPHQRLHSFLPSSVSRGHIPSFPLLLLSS